MPVRTARRVIFVRLSALFFIARNLLHFSHLVLIDIRLELRLKIDGCRSLTLLYQGTRNGPLARASEQVQRRFSALFWTCAPLLLIVAGVAACVFAVQWRSRSANVIAVLAIMGGSLLVLRRPALQGSVRRLAS